MSKQVKRSDVLQVARYVDNELGIDARKEFESRLGSEPLLQQAVAEARSQKACFVQSAAERARRAPIGLADVVLQQVARLPERKQLMQLVDAEDLTVSVAGFGRRVLAAAALLCGFAIVLGLTLSKPAQDSSLRAAEQRIRSIDERALANMKTERESGGRTGESPRRSK